MKAWIAKGYGGPEVLELIERETPRPGRGEVLVRIRATTVSAGDWRVRSLILPPGMGVFGRPALGLFRPRKGVLGTDFAGEVAALGDGVKGFKVGDRVLGFPGGEMGCHAEFRLMPADGRIVRLPEALSFTEAAALPFGGSTALSYMRRAETRPGETMLIIGASGAVGSLLLQLAVDGGLATTTLTSAGNRDLVAGLGASRTLDYAQTDLAALPDRFDIIADCVGATSFKTTRHLLKDGGRFLAIAGGIGDMIARPWQGRRAISGPADERREDLETLVGLAVGGRIRPVIDSVFAFAQMREAHARVDSGRKRGAVVISL
ncbi:NADPH:quinone reductase [Devosia enhydra]|uniref:NADPH:quinone reductase n=1 Tax=Devosia enhydra TaxID=665118 RepID=A0A1K2I3G3_9HYPH|nr:NAD(P)-dependent alcohol dehydrogenase [Devosia enhydra]SFZ86763.1 NADPH:quinone reductase [Devosia enhydra]